MQTREEWLKNRKKGIGSSEAAAVHNESPYCTALELYEEKISDAIDNDESSFVMSKGVQYEPVARKLFCAEYNIENMCDESFEPRNVVSADLPILMASLDGWSDRCIVEFKFQGLEAHKKVSEGIVPGHYMWQCQHQLLVTGSPHCWLVSYNPKDSVVLRKTKIMPDQDMWCRHIEACQELWERVQRRLPPPASEKDFTLLRSKGAKAKAKRFIYLKSKIDDLEEELDAVKQEILGSITHPKMKCYGLRIQKQSRDGSVDYSKIDVLKGIDLDQYRKPSVEFYKFDLEK